MTTRLEAVRQLTAVGQPFEIQEVTDSGRRVRAFKNAPENLRQIYAESRCQLPFLVYEDERLSFEDVWRRACALAHALVDEYGVRKGDRVAISLRNYPEWMIAFAAVTSLGAIAVAMNALWQTDELEYALADCGAAVLFADQERLERLKNKPAALRTLKVVAVRVVARPDGPWVYESFQQLVAGPERTQMPAVDIRPDDDALIVYTSGSTGRPKGAVSTHRAVINPLLAWELESRIGVLCGAVVPPKPDVPQAAVLLGIPLFHVTGLHGIYLASYRARRRIVSMFKWDPQAAVVLIERESITSFIGPPAVTGDLVEVASRTERDLSSLQSIGGGGAARAPGQLRAIERLLPATATGTGWGMTETNCIGSAIDGADYAQRPESVGRALAIVDLRVVDDQGRPVATDSPGELQVRGVSLMRCYWNQPEVTAAAFDGEWLKTGDVARIDPEGFVYIVGRLKEMINRGGEKISCAAVEAALLEHPDICEACVYALPSTRLGEIVAATIYAPTPIDPEDIQVFLASRIAKFMAPSEIVIAREPLPRLASGKIDKSELRGAALRSRPSSAGRNPPGRGSAAQTPTA